MSRAKPIYLDNNATTPLDRRVLSTMTDVLANHYGNPASATHELGWYAAELVKIARERTAMLLGARPEEIIFTSGATESINTVLRGLKRSGRIVSASTEHRAVLDPLEHMKTAGREVIVLPVESDGSLDLEKLAAACVPGTALVTLMLANNEIGTVHPIAEIARLLKPRGILLHCDAAQAAGKLPLEIANLGADFMSLTAHKTYGPKGGGVLFVSRDRQSELEPLLFGGGHEFGLRSGTLNVPAVAGAGHAFALARLEREKDVARLEALAARLWTALENGLPGIRLNGPPLGSRVPGNLNLSIPGVENSRLIGLIQTKVALSVSSACQSASKTPSHVLQALGLEPSVQRSSVRAGIGRFTSEVEIDSAAELICNAAAKIRSSRRSA